MKTRNTLFLAIAAAASLTLAGRRTSRRLLLADEQRDEREARDDAHDYTFSH